ncbi:MAG TPA: primosomal protein N' [Verrucomicrobiae bacterium]|nr:primosomal protein N' [Verrucomicrobiae bacterium]
MASPIAKVVVDLALDREFDYRIPLHLTETVQIGSRVAVPFGRTKAQGYVVGLTDKSSYDRLREIGEVIGKKPLLGDKILELTRWMGKYYCCPVELAVKCALPEVVRKAKIGWKERQFVRPGKISPENFVKLRKRAPKQARVLEVLQKSEGMFVAKLVQRADTDAGTIKKLAGKGFVVIADRVEERDPFGGEAFLPTAPLPLTPDQQQALDLCKAAIDQYSSPSPVTSLPSPILIHGVTGSGKTEIYLQAIEHTLRQGKDSIVLVPEISLTPQTVERFRARFQNQQITVLHSHLSAGERHDQWHKIRNGESHIVIGARSAVFAPVQSLGLIVIDEEHETSYKQEEAPRYNARDIAVMRGKIERAAVVLGSATPSLESFYNARRGRYTLTSLPARVDNQKMPVMRIIDMRQEAIRQKGLHVLSRKLRDAIQARLDKREQVILFLNRRGYATHLFCPKCGHVAKCPNCSVSLTYHRKAAQLLCHMCGYVGGVPKVCPNPDCRDPAIRYAGMGTEKVESAIQNAFPKARVQRMDSDMMTRKTLYREILGAFRVGKIDILVGTQMIAKGLHFPNVTLVGIIYADMALHMPDFRAGERTFQLLVQVAGRAGRGDVEGEVVVQSFTPFHPAVQYARQHDFIGFYEQEMEFREQLKYPPISRLICITARSRSEAKASFYAQALVRELQKRTPKTLAIVAGPTPAPLEKVQNQYRFQIMLRSQQIMQLVESLGPLITSFKPPEDVNVSVDVDPISLL